MKKTAVKMNKSIYLGISILDISKILMHEFWYDYIKPKYQAKLCYMDTDSFLFILKPKIFMKTLLMMLKNGLTHLTITKNDKRPLPIGKNKKVIGLFKGELGGRIIKEFVALRAKTYTYLMDDKSEQKKLKEQKSVQEKGNLCLKTIRLLV